MVVRSPQLPHSFSQEQHSAKSQAGLIGAVPAGLANTHNTFLEVWVWYGGLALLSLLLAMLSAARYFLSFIRHSDSVLRSYALGGLCLIGGYVIYGQTQIMLIRNNTLLFFLLSLAVLVALVHQRRRVVLVAENVWVLIIGFAWVLLMLRKWFGWGSGFLKNAVFKQFYFLQTYF